MSRSLENGEPLKASKVLQKETKCKNTIYQNIWEREKSEAFLPLRMERLKMVKLIPKPIVLRDTDMHWNSRSDTELKKKVTKLYFTEYHMLRFLCDSFFLFCLPPGFSPCGWTDWAVMRATLGAALLCSSRAGFDMWLLSRNSIVHRDWGRTIGVCVAL